MNVVCLLGSPQKKGNSSAIAQRFCDTAEKSGASVATFALNELNYRGCQGCMACKTKRDDCALSDDLTEVLEAVRETDVLVLASPVYFWDVSSQLKTFIDRTFSYLTPGFMTNPVKSRLAPGKKLVFVLTQGNPDSSLFRDIFPKIDCFFKAYGFAESYLIRACGVRGPGEAEGREDVMALTQKTAEAICRA
ncbi:MAG: flavodoxin family protein [Desulfovibrionaceae bacterium]|nr:flavodoxin family protein [Desulfovibrionaceae bacterium]MBF0513489.1 flavodoxin family protein [Desulfovibrionaceae bacterium]